MHRIVIDRSLCSGFGACAELAPEAFGVGSNDIASARVGSSDADAVLEAAAACPMGAIVVERREAA